MKIRTGFVSNSSSSSFLVINGSSYETLDGPLSFGNEGETRFGWGPDVIHGMYSRINFAYLQATDTYLPVEKRKKYVSMLEKVVHKHSGKEEKIVWNLSRYPAKEGEIEGYIDHQSTISEGKNKEIFENEQILKDFLFGYNSKIVLDNDNH